MKFSEAGGSSPPAVLGSQPSPTAAQLAAFSPFASLTSSSGTMDTGPLGLRNQNGSGSWSLLPAASLQLSEPAQTAGESNITDSSVFGYPLLLESSGHSASPNAGPSHAPQAAFPANEDAHGNWVSPTALGPALPIQRPGVPRPTGRRFVVRNVSTDIEGLDMLKFLKGLRDINGPHMTELNTKGHFHVAFSDLREAKQFVQWISGVQPAWEIISRTPDQFNRETRLAMAVPANFDDLILLTTYCGAHSSAQPSDIVAMVKPILDLVGNVHSIQEVHLSSPSRTRVAVHELVVRWYDTAHALNAVRALNGIRTEDFIIEAVPYHPSDSRSIHWSSEGPKSRRVTPPSGRYDNSPQPLYMSPGADPDSSPIHIPRRDSGEGARQINTRKIWQGHDTRTTVMLRNVPFTMTWLELKNALDMTSHGRFDFLYLRMDFEANQNVGYAFVNFVTPRDIVPFMEARSGRNWPGYPATRHENKLAEMSYATVQGKDALVDKFRNSPVILNTSDNRPKVFHTSGPRAGQEATFPPVNNFYTLSKGVDLGKKNGLYRAPPSRMDPQRPGTRYYRYSDSLESPMQEGYSRDFGSPTRARDPNRNEIPNTPPSALQQWNMIRDA